MDPKTGFVTWVVAFLEEVTPFRLFNASGRSPLCNKKPRIDLHNPDCQGYCNPRRCRREARCSNCSRSMQEHKEIGPCKVLAECANCAGPFPADHKDCPAAPTRNTKGHMIQLPRRDRLKVRAEGERTWALAHPGEAAAAKAATGPSITARTTEAAAGADAEMVLATIPGTRLPEPLVAQQESSSSKGKTYNLRSHLGRAESPSVTTAQALDTPMSTLAGSTQDAVTEQVSSGPMDYDCDSIEVSGDSTQPWLLNVHNIGATACTFVHYDWMSLWPFAYICLYDHESRWFWRSGAPFRLSRG